ncbi:MAG: hypothetical protein J0L75_10965 [Spirochaetes bacterium]|nr:hypothetical protein [Spirochaetota bacterium]
MTPFLIVVTVLNYLLWTACYVAAIVKGFRSRSYALPMSAVALSFAWETLFSFHFPYTQWYIHYLNLLWFFPDALIMYLILRHGPAEQPIPALKELFRPLTVFSYLAGLVILYRFTLDMGDPTGTLSALLINIVYSVAYFLMVVARPAAKGLSFTVTWTKALGTLGTLWVLHAAYPTIGDHGFRFVEATAVVSVPFDALAIILHARAIRRHRLGWA